MNKILILFAVAWLLAGCSIKEITRPIVKYSINDNSKVINNLKIGKVLKISQFKAPIDLVGDKIWYKRESLKVNSYLYSSWSQDFSSMIEQQLANSLFKSELFKSVFSGYSKARADFVLEGDIVNAVQHVEKNSAYVSFEIRLYLVDLKSLKLISSKDFSYNQKCESINAFGALKAYDEIIKIFNKEVILWLKKSIKEN